MTPAKLTRCGALDELILQLIDAYRLAPRGVDVVSTFVERIAALDRYVDLDVALREAHQRNYQFSWWLYARLERGVAVELRKRRDAVAEGRRVLQLKQDRFQAATHPAPLPEVLPPNVRLLRRF